MLGSGMLLPALSGDADGTPHGDCNWLEQAITVQPLLSCICLHIFHVCRLFNETTYLDKLVRYVHSFHFIAHRRAVADRRQADAGGTFLTVHCATGRNRRCRQTVLGSARPNIPN